MKDIYHTAQTELTTVRDFIRFAMSQFQATNLYFGHGTDNAWDEAVALILHVLHLPPDTTNKILNATLTISEKQQIINLIQKRVTDRTPLPYLTHEAYFAGLSFYVDERVLIPRSPMAELIETGFAPWVDPNSVTHVLDICTGSGCIAIVCALALPAAQIDASDLYADCLEVAAMNIEKYSLQKQIHLYQSDLFNNLPANKYDIIIANPPYVDAQDMANLPPEYRHEPKAALSAGLDGLTIINQILKNAKNYLKPKGILVVEVGNSEQAVQEQYPNMPFTWLNFQRGGDGVFLLMREQL